MNRVFLTCTAVLGLIPAVAQAVIIHGPVEWQVANGGNGHFYQLIDFESAISWTAARDDAQGRSFQLWSGHLVTVTSAAEDQFLKLNFESLIGDPNTNVPGIYAWIGLTDSVQEGNFQWVTGEPLSFTNWAPPEPNNILNEDYAHLWVRKFSGLTPNPNGTPIWSWNDAPENPGDPPYRGALVEFEPSTAVPEPATFSVCSALVLLGCLRHVRGRKS